LRDCTDAFLAIERIERYLLEPEIDSAANESSTSAAPGVVTFKKASFSHQYKNSIPYLDDLTLDLAPGTLTMFSAAPKLAASTASGNPTVLDFAPRPLDSSQTSRACKDAQEQTIATQRKLGIVSNKMQ
jgi:ABC-type multidrug transport system fused ATPase/permease subunit